MRACPSCSVISETEKSFCPECGTSYDRSSATAAANPATAQMTVRLRTYAVAGLAFYVLSWLVLPVFDDYWGWGEAFKALVGVQALTRLGEDTWWWGRFFGALSGYALLVIVIVGFKKSS